MSPEFVQTPHGPLAVTIDGADDHTVILLHGLGGDHRQALGFAPPASELDSGELNGGRRRWRKLGVDMRGHGDTETLGPPDTLNHGAFTEDLAAVLRWAADADGRPPVAVVGMSMGAELALQAAIGYQELVRSLVIVRPSGPGAPPGPAAGVYAVIVDYLRRLGPEGKGAFQRSPEFQAIARRSEATSASLLRQFDRPFAQARVDGWNSCRDRGGSPRPRSSRSRCPRWCACPRRTQRTRCAAAASSPSACPGARPLVILPQKKTTPGAHEESLRAAVGAFLAGQAAGGTP